MSLGLKQTKIPLSKHCEQQNWDRRELRRNLLSLYHVYCISVQRVPDSASSFHSFFTWPPWLGLLPALHYVVSALGLWTIPLGASQSLSPFRHSWIAEQIPPADTGRTATIRPLTNTKVVSLCLARAFCRLLTILNLFRIFIFAPVYVKFTFKMNLNVSSW